MGQVIFITGGNSGFGRRMVETLARAGHLVFAAMREVDGKNADAAHALQTLAKQESWMLEVIELDVTDDQSVHQAIRQVIDRSGRIDAAVNNAGVSYAGLIEAFTIEQARALFEVNVFGPLRINKAVLPYMRQQKAGLLIHISSTFGRLTMPFSGLYSASKFAVEGFAEAYHYELAPSGIDAVIVEPGPFPTELGTKIVFPEETQVVWEYGETADGGQKLGATLGEFFSGPDAPNPQAVADAVKQLIDMPQGRRPIRTVVDFLTPEQIEAVNQASANEQRAFMLAFGL